MLSLLTSVCLLVMACDTFNTANRPGGIQPRVSYGVDDIHDEYPYVVSLQFIANENTAPLHKYINTPFRCCTGSLITDRWVLTAAHCLVEVDKKVTLVRYGNMSLPWNNTEFFSKVLKTAIHPSFQLEFANNKHCLNDIGLLLVQNIPLRYYGRLSAIDYTSLTGLRGRYTGFGWMSLEKNRTKFEAELEKWIFKPLQIGDSAIIKCDKSTYKTSGPFICIAPPCSNKKHQSMKGDSGGPLFVDNKIVGVLTGSLNDNIINQYTPVTPYLDWINNVMSKEE